MMQNIAFLTHYEQQKGGASPMSTLTFRVELTRGEEAQIPNATGLFLAQMGQVFRGEENVGSAEGLVSFCPK